MIIMKRIFFSLSVERTPYQRRYFYRRAWTALALGKLQGARYAVRLYLIVERACRESTRDLQIIRVAYHPGNTFWRAGCPAFTLWSNGAPEFDKSSRFLFWLAGGPDFELPSYRFYGCPVLRERCEGRVPDCQQ
jgi:hypothetical protein